MASDAWRLLQAIAAYMGLVLSEFAGAFLLGAYA
jgi:hypothetical protein